MTDSQHTLKRCRVCKDCKPLVEFHKNKREKDGHRQECKPCHNAANRAHDHATRAEKLPVKRAWRQANTDKLAAYHKRWAQKKTDYVNAYSRTYRAARPGLGAEYAMRDYRKNREARMAAMRERGPEVRKRTRESRRAYEVENLEALNAGRRSYKARKRGAEGRHTAEDIGRIFSAQGGRCGYCRSSIADGYHVDHITPLIKGGSNWPNNLQLLCQPCNNSKRDRDPLEHARTIGRLL